MKVNIYLSFNRNCEEAFGFYSQIFGTEFSDINRFREIPLEEGKTLPEEDKNLVMHVSLPISEQTILMGCDVTDQYGKIAIAGNNIALSLETESRDQATKLFEALSIDGQIQMPLQDTFWGSYFGMLTDKFNISWMINYTPVPS